MNPRKEIVASKWKIRGRIEDLKDINLIERILLSLKNMETETGINYNFVRIQEGLNGYYLLLPEGYNPSSRVTHVLGRYDKESLLRIKDDLYTKL